MATTKHTYVLLFRGEHVQTFTTVSEQQAVLLGYRRYPNREKGETHLSIPTGDIARKPVVLRSMKTVAALKRSGGAGSQWSTYPGQTFIISVTPGTTEITEVEAIA